MIILRKSGDRGHFTSEWLESYHTFSFDTYQDPDHMGFRTLRVINQDRVLAGQGFPLHAHRDMEILSLVLEGAIRHQDSLGHAELIRAGEVQRISAGTGIMHSEYNASDSEDLHFMQIWVLPEEKGLTPSYEKRSFASKEQNSLQPIASREGKDGSILIHQDVRLYAGSLAAGACLDYALDHQRHAWVQVVSGNLTVNDRGLEAGDGAAVSDEAGLRFVAGEGTEFFLFDL